MALLPSYKRTMENDYSLLREILLHMTIPEVYKTVLNGKSCDMKHALAIVRILNHPLQQMAVQQMGRSSTDRRWKLHSTALHPCSSATAICRDDAFWFRREWDSETLIAFCQLPVRRFFADAMKSNAFNMQEVLAFVGMPLAKAQSLDLIRAMLATIPVPLLCSELCSLHDRLESPPFLDQTSNIGMMHYLAAMIASRHLLFTVGMPEIMPQSTQKSDGESQPCQSCMESIIAQVQEKGLLHAGLSQAMRHHQVLQVARGGWSRFNLIVAQASTNRELQSVLDHQLAQCSNGPSSYCREMVTQVDLPRTKTDVLVLDKMTALLEEQGFDITKLACAYNVNLDKPSVLCVLEHVEKHGELTDFVQDIFMQNQELGISLAMVF